MTYDIMCIHLVINKYISLSLYIYIYIYREREIYLPAIAALWRKERCAAIPPLSRGTLEESSAICFAPAVALAYASGSLDECQHCSRIRIGAVQARPFKITFEVEGLDLARLDTLEGYGQDGDGRRRACHSGRLGGETECETLCSHT